MVFSLYGLHFAISRFVNLRNIMLHYTTRSIHSSILNSLLYYPPELKYTYMCIVIYYNFYVVLIIHVDNMFNQPFIIYLRNCQVNILKEISKNREHSFILHLYLHDIQLVCIIIDNSIIYEINIFLELIFTFSDHTSTYTYISVCYMFPYQMSYCNARFIANLPSIYKIINVSRYMYEYIYQTEIVPLSKKSEINEEHTLILPLLSVLTLQITIMDSINDILYIFLFTLCYISIIPFTSIFHAITIFTNHIVYYINVLCYFINCHPGLYPFLHTINIIHLDILRINDVPRIHVFICPTIHCYKGMSITFDETCMRIPILNGTMFYFVIILYIPFLLQFIVTCKMYLPASNFVIDFVSSIIKHSLVYTDQDQNYICIHIKILPHVILCNSYTLVLHLILYTYLHTLINTYQSVSRFIRWNPRMRSVTCFKMSTSKVILYFYCLTRYAVIQSHINYDIII